MAFAVEQRLAVRFNELEPLVRRKLEPNDRSHEEVVRAVRRRLLLFLPRQRAAGLWLAALAEAPAIQEPAATHPRVLDARFKHRERVVLEEKREHELALRLRVDAVESVEPSAEAELLLLESVVLVELPVLVIRSPEVKVIDVVALHLALNLLRVDLEELPLGCATGWARLLRLVLLLRHTVCLEVVVSRERVAVFQEEPPREHVHEVSTAEVSLRDEPVFLVVARHAPPREQHGKVATALAFVLGLDDLHRVVAQVVVQHVLARLRVERVRILPRHEEPQHVLPVLVELAPLLGVALTRCRRFLSQPALELLHFVHLGARVVGVLARCLLRLLQGFLVVRPRGGVTVHQVDRAAVELDVAAHAEVLRLEEHTLWGHHDSSLHELALRHAAVRDTRLGDRDRVVAQVEQEHKAPHAMRLRLLLVRLVHYRLEEVPEEAQHLAVVRDPLGLRRVLAALGAHRQRLPGLCLVALAGSGRLRASWGLHVQRRGRRRPLRSHLALGHLLQELALAEVRSVDEVARIGHQPGDHGHRELGPGPRRRCVAHARRSRVPRGGGTDGNSS